MTIDNIIKRRVLYLLRHNLCTQKEAGDLFEQSKQIVRHWARDLPYTRDAYLEKIKKQAIKAVPK